MMDLLYKRDTHDHSPVMLMLTTLMFSVTWEYALNRALRRPADIIYPLLPDGSMEMVFIWIITCGDVAIAYGLQMLSTLPGTPCIVVAEKAKCGETYLSIVPTVLWVVGAAVLAQRLLMNLFRRFLFRRVPLWELVLQHLLFIWMVIYSLHFWVMFVKILKAIMDFCYEENQSLTAEDLETRKTMQQWVLWFCGAAPLAYYIRTRPRPESPPLMIWITTSPWQRREMGPYGYYLSRPLSLQSTANESARRRAPASRRAYSDSQIVLKDTPTKKRHSKSV